MSTIKPKVNPHLLAIAMTLSAFIGFSSCAAKDIEPTIDGEVLEFAAPDLDGNLVTHEDERFKDKVVLVDIWGTWCPPCRDSVPKLIELQDEYGNEGLVVLGVAFEEETEDTEARRKALREFEEEQGINYLLLDGREIGGVPEVFTTLEGFRGFPTMIIIGRDGNVAHANTVFVPRENKKIRKETEKALGVDEE